MIQKVSCPLLLMGLSVSVLPAPAHAGLCESLLAKVASRMKFEGPPAWHNKAVLDEESELAEKDPKAAEQIPQHFVKDQVSKYVEIAMREGLALQMHVLMRHRTLYMEDLTSEDFAPGSLIVVNSASGLVHAFFRPAPSR